MTAQQPVQRSTVDYWHTSYSEPCARGPATASDALCLEHGLLVAPAGTNGWPTDLNDLGDRRLRAYTATNWFDVIQVLNWHPKSEVSSPRHGVEYTVVVANGARPFTVTTDTVAII